MLNFAVVLCQCVDYNDPKKEYESYDTMTPIVVSRVLSAMREGEFPSRCEGAEEEPEVSSW